MAQPPSCSADFRLSLTKALADQLGDTIQQLEPAPLDRATVGGLKAEPGVYQLYRFGSLVYIGKADKSLRDRLTNHVWKLAGRQNISLGEMTFACLYVLEDLSAVAPEALLIKRYQEDGMVLWNTNGFGGRDPGRQRDTTVVAADHFDAAFPIDLEAKMAIPAGQTTAKQYLKLLKDSLPYIFRYDSTLARTGPIATATVLVEDELLTACQAFRLAMTALPPGWQLTALPGRAILYRETRPDAYGSALKWWRREQNEAVVETTGRHLLDESRRVAQFDFDELDDGDQTG